MKTQVLVVVDDPIMGNLLEVRLSEAGYPTRYVAAGQEALALAREDDGQGADGLAVLSDVTLSGMDGIEFRQKLRSDPATARVPVIFLPGKAELTRRLTDLCGEIDVYVPKPFKLEELIERLETLIGPPATKPDAEPETDRGPGREAPGTAPAESPSGMPADTPGGAKPRQGDEPPPLTAIEDGLAGVLASFEARGVTGLLEVRNTPVKAAVHIERGRIIHAVHGAATGRKALYRIFAEAGAAPEFHEQPVDVKPTVDGSLAELLAEGDREVATLRRLKPGALDSRLAVDDRRLAEADGVKAHRGLAYTIDLVREHGRLREVLDASRMQDLHTYKNVVHLLKQGVLRLEGDRPAVQLVTDSSVDLPERILREREIRTVPVSVGIGKRTYREIHELSAGRFYEMLEAEREFPEISFPAMNELHRAFAELIGERDILAVFSSTHLNRTYRNAIAARDINIPRYRDAREKGLGRHHPPQVEIVDSGSISLGMGLLLLDAADRLAAGAAPETVRAHVAGLVDRVRVFLVVEDLDHLRRSGTVESARTLLGRFYGLRMILGLRRGRIKIMDRSLSGKTALDRMVSLLEWSLDDPAAPHRMGVMHGADTEQVEPLVERLRSRFDCREILVSQLGPAMGTWFGPRALGLACLPADGNDPGASGGAA